MSGDLDNRDEIIEAQPENKGAKEHMYDKVPLSVKQLNIIIAVLAVAFIAVFVLGALKGNGIL